MSETELYKPIDPLTIANPFSVFAELRSKSPIFWHDEMQSWVVSRYVDCREILRNHALFAKDPRRAGLKMREERRNIQTEDPPELLTLRGIMMRALHSQDIDGICTSARCQFQNAVLERASQPSFNLMTLAGPAAMDVINRIVGSVEYTAASYAPIFRDLTRAMDSGLDLARLEPGRAAGIALSDGVATWFTATPNAGMISDLNASPIVAEMPRHYVENSLGGVFNAGFSTLYASTGSIALLLLERMNLLDSLPETLLSQTGVDELLRFISPAQATSRLAVVDTEIGGVKIQAGSSLIVLMAAANRDPAIFENPDELHFDRSPNPHLAFAWGPHVCLGAQLAKAWAAEIIRFLHETRGRIELVGEPSYMDTATFRNITDLPIIVR